MKVMMGYYKNPEATAEVLQDGWLRTGDIVTYDEEQYLTIVDRIKDMIKVTFCLVTSLLFQVKGLQVSPTEVEEVVAQVPGVQEVSVVGVDHPTLGEAPRAFVVSVHGSCILLCSALQACCAL